MSAQAKENDQDNYFNNWLHKHPEHKCNLSTAFEAFVAGRWSAQDAKVSSEPLLVARIKRYKQVFGVTIAEAKVIVESDGDLNAEKIEFIAPACRGSIHKDDVEPVPFSRPNKWSALLTSDNHGLLAEFGETFDGHPAHYERVNVYAVAYAKPTDLSARLRKSAKGHYEGSIAYANLMREAADEIDLLSALAKKGGSA